MILILIHTRNLNYICTTPFKCLVYIHIFDLYNFVFRIQDLIQNGEDAKQCHIW